MSTEGLARRDQGTSTRFDLLPAIDLRAGRVVRLMRGDPRQETRYDDDPVATAERFAEAGCRWLHVVDLDAAFGGESQSAIVTRIIDAVGPKVAVQVAGGLRTEEDVDRVLEAGAARAVLGTAILREPDLAGRLVGRLGAEQLVAAIDVRGDMAVGDGWRAGGTATPIEAAVDRLDAQGVCWFAVTAIDRDGTRSGPDLDLLGRIVRPGRSVIASAGIRWVDDLLAVRDAGAVGAIVGRAIYEGDLEPAEAVERLRLDD